MAKRQYVPLCSRCEAPLRADAAFCVECEAPTPWATHEDRVAWEVRQWRASRAGEAPRSGQMMLVRTEEGFQPAPVAPRSQANGHTDNGHSSREEQTTAETSPAPVEVTPERRAVPEPESSEDVVSISKKAVAVGIALALGLPLGSKALSLSRNTPEAAKGPAVAVAPARPVPLAAVRSGYVHLSPDAVRYAVIIRNPNRSYTAQDVTLIVSLRDRAGRLVGTDLERAAVVPPSGTVALAGVTGVSGPVGNLSVRLQVGQFSTGNPNGRFSVRGVRLTRRGGKILVRATVSGRRAVAGARVVAVHLDARGAIVGGDVAYVDVPRAPHSTTAVITTSGLGTRARRVEVYVVTSR